MGIESAMLKCSNDTRYQNSEIYPMEYKEMIHLTCSIHDSIRRKYISYLISREQLLIVDHS